MSPFGANLARRVATAVVALPLLLAAFFLGPPSLTVALVALALSLGLWEFFRLLEARGLRPLKASGSVLALALFADVARPGWAGSPLWPLAALLLLCTTLLSGREIGERIPDAAGTLLGAVYLAALGGTLAGLRVLPPTDDGAWRMVLLLGIVMASDTLAFFSGHLLGRRKLAPSVSPAKTVEGAFGGILGGTAGALVVRSLGLPSLPLEHALILGVLVSALGTLGDLEESLLKRWAGVKESGALFPGHGGMLDRLDALLFGAPALYYYFNYFSLSP